MKYRYAGKERLLAFGVSPEVTLAEARQRRAEARELLRSSRYPSAERQATRQRAILSAENIFGAIKAEWLAQQQGVLADVTRMKAEWLPGFASSLDNRTIAEIAAPDVPAVLRPIESAGNHETTHRVRQRISDVFGYAIATGRAERDPTIELRGALKSPVSKSRAALTAPDDVANLLRAMDFHSGQATTLAALRLASLLFVRPGNLRAMEWAELDMDAAEWRIPAGKMKMREAHIVPLPLQVVAIRSRGYLSWRTFQRPSRVRHSNAVKVSARSVCQPSRGGWGYLVACAWRLIGTTLPPTFSVSK